MAIQDDFTIDYVDRKITFATAFVDDRPPSIYTVNELYSFLQDTFDEPAQMDDPIPMSAQTPTQYTFLYPWFIDDNSIKALYGGSIQTSSWTKAASEGITALRWADSSTDPPSASEIGNILTGGGSGATGVLLYVDTVRQVAWVRNTSAAQFQNAETLTGTGVTDMDLETIGGFASGEDIWANLFSVGSLQTETEIYVGQEDDHLGGRAFHTASTFQVRIEKVDEWWDADVDFATGSPNLLGGAGHFDVLMKTQDAGAAIDGSRLAVYARQFSKIYSHFELVGGVGNFVIPFASTGSDLNSQDGPYTCSFDARANNDLEVGDVIENTTGVGSNAPEFRLRGVVRAVTGAASATGTVDYYLIGENEPLTTTDRTLVQFADNDNMKVRGDDTVFDVNGAVTLQGPALAAGVTVTFANTAVDVDETSGAAAQQFACTIDCNSVALADVYKRVMFLTTRGNQDGTVADTQDTLLQTAVAATDEAGEFYRAVGDIVFDYDGGIGSQVSEGDYVIDDGSVATGVVISGGTVGMGTTGICVLHQVKGSWVNDDQVARPTEHGTNRIVVNEAVTGVVAIVDNTSAPFGTFAGGRWFVAQGVVLINVPTADANNWETTDLGGTRRVPPTQRTITFAGLVANDRAFLAEVDTPGGIDITKNQNGVGAAGAAQGATSIPLDATVALDVPTSGWARVVDTSSTVGEEYRFDYSTVAATTLTLRAGAGLTGTLEVAGASSTVLVDTGKFTTIGADGEVKIGMLIRNTTTNLYATVLRRIDNNSIETTVVSGAGTWASVNTWVANEVVTALVDADTIYFPFIDDVAAATTITSQIKYVGDTDLIARARFSDPDIGGQRILPFEQLNVTLTDADLTVTAIRTDDTIAA